MTELCETDKALWAAFTEAVTPLQASKVTRSAAPHRTIIESSLSGAVPHTLDLHGLTLLEAHAETMAFIAAAQGSYRAITVVTGRRGMIKQEFVYWIEQHPLIGQVEEINDGGAYCIHFVR